MHAIGIAGVLRNFVPTMYKILRHIKSDRPATLTDTGLCVLLCTLVMALSAVIPAAAKKPVIAPSYAWGVEGPLGVRVTETIDTLYENFSHRYVPQEVSTAWAATGNYCAEGRQMIWSERKPMSDFMFRDAIETWIPTLDKARFYNTRIPMTLLSYAFGGGSDTGQDALNLTFSGNAGPRIQVGALLDYLYSKGSYANQAAKNLNWGFSGSYTGERLEFQGLFTHYNLTAMANGGITDDLYITDPAEVQGGNTSVNPKDIPVNLTHAQNRTNGTDLWLNTRYKLGFYKEEQVNDTTVKRTLVPVTSFIWTLRYTDGWHKFLDNDPNEGAEFWRNTYFNPAGTSDRARYHSLKNTLGVSLLEGFNKWAKAGLAAFATIENRHYEMTTAVPDELSDAAAEILTPNPYPDIRTSENQTLLWVGAQLLRQKGRILNYDITGQIGLVGEAAGEVKVDGRITTSFPLLGDSAAVNAFGSFTNLSAPWFAKHYLSNHFIWDNDFGKTRSFRVGGEIALGKTATRISAGVENVQNLIYFNSQALPVQASGSVQIVNATLHQNLHAGPVHWDNLVTFQTSTRQDVVPLPKLALNTNLYVLFRIATLKVQFGVSCDYFTKYKSLGFEPSTMAFYNKNAADVGNYPFINVYVNCKLSKTRFFLIMSHVNQGLTGSNYFSMTHYPMNPRRFQLGLSIDFAN